MNGKLKHMHMRPARTYPVSVQAKDLNGLMLFSEMTEAELTPVVAAPRVHCGVRGRDHVPAACCYPPHSLRLTDCCESHSQTTTSDTP